VVGTSLEERKAICRWGYQALWNSRDLDVIDEVVAEDVVVHDVVHGDLYGRDGMRQLVTAFQAAFPDLELTIEGQVAEGDTVVTRYSLSGTHDGDALDVAPSGKRVTLAGVNVSRFEGMQIVEVWEAWDALRLVQDLGLRRRWRGFAAPRPSRGGAQPVRSSSR
jgi:steroid delta-isomerase-like uncharacterized protein